MGSTADTPLTSIEQLIRDVLSPEAAEAVIKAGRMAPCSYMTGLSGCQKGYRDGSCLTCLEYEIFESGNFGPGYASFEYGRVVHLVRSIETDGTYRSGTTFRDRDLDEGGDQVEIYPACIDDFAQDQVCKKCWSDAHRER